MPLSRRIDMKTITLLVTMPDDCDSQILEHNITELCEALSGDDCTEVDIDPEDVCKDMTWIMSRKEHVGPPNFDVDEILDSEEWTRHDIVNWLALYGWEPDPNGGVRLKHDPDKRTVTWLEAAKWCISKASTGA
jgi:hypothetical protein